MPVQQQMASFAKRMGGAVAQANDEFRDKPVDTGNRRLPAGIRDGIAKLSTMYTKEQMEDNGRCPKGEVFFRASAIVVSPKEFNGEKIEGMITSVVIPLCPVPAKGLRKAETFKENYDAFQNVFKLLGIPPCPETGATDPTGQRTEAYFFAAMQLLTDPARIKTNPVYLSFSTRGWTPPASPQQPKPEQMVFETWHGLAQWNGQHDPAAGATDPTPPAATTPPTQAPPTQLAPTTPPTQSTADDYDRAETIAALIDIAMGDPEGATQEGADASAQLEQMAWDVGWTKEQTASPPAPFTNDWAGVGNMALTPPTPQTTPPAAIQGQQNPSVANTSAPIIGSKWGFCKRSKDGEKLKNAQNVPFPAQGVEVVSVDTATKTCTLKTVKDGKEVVDIRSKKPIAAKWEWLEPITAS